MHYKNNFKDLRRKLDAQAVADFLGLPVKRDGKTLRCECPIHGGGKRSLVITPQSEKFDYAVWKCHAPKAAHEKGGDLIALTAKVLNMSIADAANRLMMHFFGAKPVKVIDKTGDTDWAKIAARLKSDHETLRAMKVTPEGCARFSGTDILGKPYACGWNPTGLMVGRILIPVLNLDDVLMGYCGRASKPSQEPLVTLPKNVAPDHHILGAHLIREGPVAITQDPLKMILAWQHDRPCVCILKLTKNSLAFLADWLDDRAIEEITVL